MSHNLTSRRPTRSGRSPFVEREKEMATLTGRLEAAGRREGQVVFVGGEPGIGKSRLLRHFADTAHGAGWLTLAGSAHEAEGMPPYLPFSEVIRDHLGHVSDEALLALAAGAPELCVLIPEVRSGLPGLAEPPNLGPEVNRFRLFEAVSAFLATVSRQSEVKGLVVLLDDLHWADRSTLQLFQHVARKLAGTPMLVVAAYRTTGLDPADAFHRVLADLARERLCEQLILPPLSETGTAALAAGLAGTAGPAFISILHRETGGNPFFIEEVVRHLLERGSDLSDSSAGRGSIPEGVRQVLDQRLSRLSAETNAMLQAAAVLGDAFTFELLSATCALELEPLTEAVEEAERAGMLREERDGYAFAHALLRLTVYDGLSVPRRRQIHLRAAEALESLQGGALDSSLAAAAHHWRAGGHPERATAHLLRAGDAAITMTAWEEAIRHWEAALECMEQTGEPPARRARLLEGIGDLHFLSSLEAHPCVECYEQASALYESAGDLVGSARAKSRAGRSLAYPTSGFDYPGALDHLRAAEKVLGARPPSAELGELYAAIAHAESHALRNGPEQMIEAMRLLEEISGKLDSEFLQDLLRVQSYHLKGHYLGLQGHLADGLALEELACETAAALKDKGGPANEWPERWHEFLLAYSSDDERPTADDAGSFQFSRVHSRFGLSNFLTSCCGWQSLDLLDPVRARAKHESCRDAQGRFTVPLLHYDLVLCGDVKAMRQLVDGGTSAISPLNPTALAVARSMLDWAEGRWEVVLTDFDIRQRQYTQDGWRTATVITYRWSLRTARVTGDLAAAHSAAAAGLSIALSCGAVKYEFIFGAELALLLAEAGRLEEAEPYLARCREILAAGEDWLGIRGRFALAEAVAAAARGDSTAAEAEFERAVDVFRRLSLPWDEAEAFELLARSCHRLYRSRSRQPFIAEKLSAARALYKRIGAGQPWFDRLDAAQRSLSGGRLDGAALAAGAVYPDGLTMREVEVLRLIAGGKSSREIGNELVLSVRTVERHIANIYAKTATNGRAQATSYAIAHGLSNPVPSTVQATND